MNLAISKLTENNKELVSLLSNKTNSLEKYIVLLYEIYGFVLTRKELTLLLKLSDQTLSRRIDENINIPNFIRSSNGSKASYLFPIISVAEYLLKTIKVN